MPFPPPVIDVFMALTISLTFEFSEPVHWYEHPSSLHASSAPYFVGTNTRLWVTGSSSPNFSFWVEPKIALAPEGPPPPDCGFGVALADWVLLELEPQAASI